MPRLGEIEPRERAGAKTGRRYEYQYERAARWTLTLLDHQLTHVCIYCDWHDDFVLERDGPPTRYVFHQVKGRESKYGPWTFADFFGLSKREALPLPIKPPKVVRTAIVPRMLLHHEKFGPLCAGTAFVTNTGVEAQLATFLAALVSAEDPSKLDPVELVAFDYIASAYLVGKTPLASSRTELFERLRTISLSLDHGHLEDGNHALLELVDLVEHYSEVNLLLPESKNIARQIIQKVRIKAHHSTTKVPATDEQLRKEKGIVLDELLSLLSLSSEGYEALKRGDPVATVKTLSRLQRYCLAQGRADLVVPICAFKAGWDAWRTIERHSMDPLDYVLLVDKAKEVVVGSPTIARMVEEARAIAAQFAGRTAHELNGEHVLGLMVALIAESEPSVPGR
jgi:hypothetical protein